MIPENIKQFLIQYIDSIAQLELLLLLKREPDTIWNIETVAKRLYINTQDTEILIASLYNFGFIGKITSINTEPTYIYQPNSSEIKEYIEQLTDLYAKYLIPVTNIIHSKSNNRIRQFAAAFRIRRD